MLRRCWLVAGGCSAPPCPAPPCPAPPGRGGICTAWAGPGAGLGWAPPSVANCADLQATIRPRRLLVRSPRCAPLCFAVLRCAPLCFALAERAFISFSYFFKRVIVVIVITATSSLQYTPARPGPSAGERCDAMQCPRPAAPAASWRGFRQPSGVHAHALRTPPNPLARGPTLRYSGSKRCS